MKDYHNLESEVLSIFRQINEDENNKEIAKLLNVFQKYWKSYQDNWPSRYWDIYNLVYDENYINNNNNNKSDSEKSKNNKETNESSKNNLKENQFKVNNLDEESIISVGDFKNGIEMQNEIDKNNNNKTPFFLNNESLLTNYCQQKKKRNLKKENLNAKDKFNNEKNNLKNKERKENSMTNSLTNLDDIDKELDELKENNYKNKKGNLKERGCLDCRIF